MATHYLSTARQIRSPVRCQQWNASVRAGDDFKLALTVYDDDGGTPSQVGGARSQLALWPDLCGGPQSCDYGFGWFTGGSPIGGFAAPQAIGFTTALRAGGINFVLPSTLGLCHGRYRLAIQVDLPDGSYTQVEGILQIRESWGFPVLGHTAAVFFELDVTPLDSIYPLAPAVVNGVPVDIDGFPLTVSTVIDGLSVDSLTLLLATLPTSLPATPGVLWMNGGILCLS